MVVVGIIVHLQDIRRGILEVYWVLSSSLILLPGSKDTVTGFDVLLDLRR